MIKLNVLFDARMQAYKDLINFLPPVYDVTATHELANMSDKMIEELVSDTTENFLCVLTGGNSDVHPHIYKEKTIHHRTVVRELDDLNADKIVELSLQYEFPLVGVCRGFQMMWAVSGGSIAQDLLSNTHHGDHAVAVSPHLYPTEEMKNLLATSANFMVNSSHHQACLPTSETQESVMPLLLSRGTCATVVGDQGSFKYLDHPIVEAGLWTDRAWGGVQYHPEWSGCPSFGKDFFRFLVAEVMNASVCSADHLNNVSGGC